MTTVAVHLVGADMYPANGDIGGAVLRCPVNGL